VAADQSIAVRSVCCRGMQLLRKSYNELKVLEAVSSSQTDSSEPAVAERQQELVEKVLKNVAIASEVLQVMCSYFRKILRLCNSCV